MKALSVMEPWAWLIVNGIKDVENRDWYTHYRGPLLIHASRRVDAAPEVWEYIHDRVSASQMDSLGSFTEWTKWMPRGAIIGKVDLKDCLSYFDAQFWHSKWLVGRYCWLMRDAVMFETVIPYKGRLGLFNVPDELIKEAVCSLKSSV